MVKLPAVTSSYRGFTLVELIIVILIISVLAVSALPRLTDNSGYAEHTYQARLLSTLRNIQTLAMFDTRANYCFQVNFDLSLPAFGPPDLDYSSGNQANTCLSTIDYSNPEHLTTTPSEISEHGVTLSTEGDNNTRFNYVRFDSLGRPLTDNTTCLNGCKITFTGEASLSVCIESEGYIHACE